MENINRRDFVKSVGAGVALSLAAGIGSNVMGANDRIRLGIVGLNSKGASHVNNFSQLENVQVAALCDVDRDVLNREKEKFTQKNTKVDTYTDIRKLLDDKDIDAIVVVTPNHWHSLMGIWACQAGKDVYVEKPVSHDVWEGRQLVSAAKKYKRIVQAGTQSRSDEALKEVFQYIQDGNLGKMKLVWGFCYKQRPSIGKVKGPQSISPSVDYNLWTGPAPLQPLMREKLHYDWHWQWDTGNGDIGNQGIHQLDMCRWATGQELLPERVMSIGGRFGYNDDGETANTQIIFYDYKPVPIIFEVRGLPARKDSTQMDHFKGIRIGIVIECEHGYFAGGAGGGWIYDNNGKRGKQFSSPGGGGHHGNFIDAMRSRRESDLNAPIIEGHVSSGLAHLANISHRIGVKNSIDVVNEQCKSYYDMNKVFYRLQSHLFENWVDLSKDLVTMGPDLEFDPKAERFISNVEYDQGYWANTMLKRQSVREPFVVKEIKG